jgi:crotonobetainyl-CoA:carnitine CoA-transferase CaiB-like acyl-CoA transferase
MTAPLSHLTVIEIGENQAAGYCGRLLAAYGARVIKIEPPERGDPTRSRGPFIGDPGAETSVSFLWLHMGKESVVCNLETAQGQELVRQLAVRADSRRPGHRVRPRMSRRHNEEIVA